MTTSVNLLIIEDEQDHIERILGALREAGLDGSSTFVHTEREFVTLLRSAPLPDIILANYALHEIPVQRILREQGLNIPLIVIGGTIGEEAVVECLRQGAVDYVHLDRLARLGSAVQRALPGAKPDGKKDASQRPEEKRVGAPERNYRTLFEQSQDAMFVTSPDGGIVDCNQAMSDIFGYSRDELLRINAADLYVEPEDRLRFRRDIEAAGSVRDFETRLRRKDGSTMICAVTATLQRDEAGTPLVYEGIIRDITGRLQAEAAVRRSEARVRAVIDNTPMVAVEIYDLAGRVVFWNKAAAHLFGFSQEEALGKTLDQLILDATACGEFQDMLKRVHTSGQSAGPTEWRFTGKGGQTGYIVSTIFSIPSTQDSPEVIRIDIDITERKRDQEVLRQKAEEIERFFSLALDLFCIANTDGYFLRLNKEWEKTLGYRLEDLEGKRFLDLVHPDDLERTLAAVGELAAGKPILNFTNRYRCQDGSYRWIEWRSVPYQNKLIYAAARDITEHIQTEETLRQSEEKFYKAFHTSPDSININRLRDGLYLDINDGFTQLTGYTRDDAIGRSSLELEIWADPADRARLVQGLRERGEVHNLEAPFRVKDGSIRTGLMSARTIEINGEPCILSITRDISERKRAEEALQRRDVLFEALASISRQFLQSTDPGAVMMEILAQLGPAVRASRVHVFENFTGLDGRPWTRERYEWVAPGIAPTLDFSERQAIPYAIFGELYNRWVANGTAHALTRDLPPPIRGLLERSNTLSLVTVPIFCGGVFWGLLNAAECQTEREWLPMEIEAMRSVAGTLEAALLRQQVEAAEHEQRVLSDALRDTAAALTSTLDPSAVMTRVLDDVGHVVPHDAANIMLIEGESTRAIYWRGYTDERPVQSAKFPLDAYSLRQMINTGAPYIVVDTRADPNWLVIPGTEWIRSYLGVPLRAHGVVIGFLNLDSATPGFFSVVMAARLQAFADQAAIAIENAQLYTELRSYADTLEQRVRERTAEIEEQQAQLQAILDGMAEGVAHLDLAQDRTIYVNRAFSTLTGFSSDDVVGKPLDTFLSVMEFPQAIDKTRLSISASLAQGSIWRSEGRLRRPDGTEIDIDLTLTAVPMKDGSRSDAVALFRDVSQEKALQAQKDRFIANAAHELRTPVTNLKMRLYLAQRQPEQVLDHLHGIERATTHLTHLVEALLDISRFERGVILLNRQPVVLNDLVERVVDEQQPQAEQKHIHLTAQFPERSVRVQADPDRILQVIGNLVSNAINYTPQDGHILVQLGVEVCEHVPCAVIQVQDSGIGIASEALSHLFEPFFRAAVHTAKGTGLGLTIAKEIVDLHQGHIEVESQVGIGSTFSVWLPLDA